MANLEFGIPLDTSTRLATASVAKPVTALVIGTLIDEGKLTLNTDARTLIPEIAHYPGPLTIRELLTHTSGVRDFRQLLAMAGWRSEDLILPSDVLRVLSRQKTTSFTPGTEYTYSNSDFFLLAEIAARTLKKPFAEIASERVFTPLGMSHSVFLDWVGELVERRATGYGHQQRGWRILHRYDDIPGPGDMYTTVPDLMRFLANLDSVHVGSRAFVELMQSPAQFTNGRTIDVENSGDAQGFAFAISTFAGRKTVTHDGGTPGFLANITWLPTEHIAVTTMCDTWALDLPAVMRGLLAHLVDTTSRGTAAAPNVATARTQEYVEAVPGVYQNAALRYLFRIHIDHDSMLMGKTALVQRADGSYSLANNQEARVAFRKSAKGRPTLLLWNSGQTSPEVYELRRAGNRPDTVAQSRLADYAGSWYSPELDYEWRFEPREGRLALSGPSGMPIRNSTISASVTSFAESPARWWSSLAAPTADSRDSAPRGIARAGSRSCGAVSPARRRRDASERDGLARTHRTE